MSAFNLGGFQAAVKSAAAATPASTRYVSHAAAANYSQVYKPTSKLIKSNMARSGAGLAGSPNWLKARVLGGNDGITRAAAAGVKGARHGKLIAGVVAGGLALNAMRNRSGRAVDPVRGRPTGVYGY